MRGKLSQLLDASGYKHWHDSKQTDQEKAKIAFDFVLKNYQKAPPTPLDKTPVPNYGDGTARIGSLYGAAKIANRQQKIVGVHGELANLFNSSDYKHWHHLMDNLQTDKEKTNILFNFILENYQKAPPGALDKTLVPNYGDGTLKIGHAYFCAKQARKHHRKGVFVELAKLLDSSNYKHWHDGMAKLKQTSKEKAKIGLDFIFENYQDFPPRSTDKTPVPNYGDGKMKIGRLYDAAKQAKRKQLRTGAHRELANLLDSSDYEFWPRNGIATDEQTSKQSKRARNEELDDNDDDEEIERPPKKTAEKCQHVWKELDTDETHRRVECEKCGRKSKQLRVAAEKGYTEANPEKKAAINNWLAQQNYLPGCAWLLDSHGMKTTRALVTGKRFRAEEIVVPEYDDDVFEANSQDREFGSCLRRGDFLENLKRAKTEELSLIYADFTGRYETFVRPLFQYLEETPTKLRPGTLVGVTWSNNGAGTQTQRSRIDRHLGGFISTNGFDPIDDQIVSESGYGEGGHMNVQFMIKK